MGRKLARTLLPNRSSKALKGSLGLQHRLPLSDTATLKAVRECGFPEDRQGDENTYLTNTPLRVSTIWDS